MRYTAKKIGTLVLTMVLVSLFVFLAFSLLSGDAATRMLGTEATPERLEALRAELGLDKPMGVRYVKWLGALLRGDMGTSYQYRLPVAQLIGERLRPTLTLTLMAFALIVVVSIPLGVVTAKYAGGFLDRTSTVLGQFLMSVPPFFTGILFTYIFGLVLHTFVPGAFPQWEDGAGRYFGYLFFPALSIALPRIAMTVRMLHGCILDEAQKDYVRTSMSRGRSRGNILYVHVLKNTLVPLVTFLAMTMAELVAGSVIIEQVFSVPGVGRLLISGIANRDAPVVQAVVTLVSFWVVVCNLAGDLIGRRIDPRLRTGEGGRS
ncbi:MAG: ABC transporter permease [Oscillospiraceae bacterium]|nr:ABC transporter permease [Oscillospiraceae bacterium]